MSQSKQLVGVTVGAIPAVPSTLSIPSAPAHPVVPRESTSPPAVRAAGPTATTKTLMNMGIGGFAGALGIMVVYPMDSIKTVIQLRREAKEKVNIRSTLNERVKSEGFGCLYRGLPAAVMRQFFFASIRLGLYFNIADYIKAKQNKRTLTFLESTATALGSGAVAVSAAMPLDVIFVRFQADHVLPVGQKRGYTSVFNAFTTIIKSEGVTTLWRGLVPAVVRGMAVNFGMLVPYEKCKAFFAPYLGYTRSNYLLSSAIAGLTATFCCCPFDNMKVRLQKMKSNPDGTKPYKGMTDCFIKCAKNEGLRSIWSGFLPFYFCAGIHSMLVLLFSDALRIMLGVTTR